MPDGRLICTLLGPSEKATRAFDKPIELEFRLALYVLAEFKCPILKEVIVRKRLSIVVPIHNEEESIPFLFDTLESIFAEWDVEYVAVDDGSTDSSLAMLKKRAATMNHLRVVVLSRNFGHQNAIRAGMDYCTGDYIAFVDADLQDPPEEIIPMVALLDQGANLVYAVRRSRTDGLFKKLLAWAYYRILNKAATVKIPVDVGDFSVMDRQFLQVMKSYSERNLYLRGLRSFSGFTQLPYYYDRPERAYGKPSYTFLKSLRLGFSGLVGFTSAPLKLLSYVGFIVTVCAFCFGIFVLMKKWFYGIDVEGWASLAILFTFFFGLQFLFLGIMGEYLIKIYDEGKARPNYIVKVVINE